ncbi:hypothetical protein Ahy_B06g080163 [Arachis hypogaea]|uniref:Transposase MuDR plant domain-containing protein n=1 Tax=Arachis hypogaea TaxID=3818 RepID=A0A444YHA2_ARAHY|nr:hypothetical protein Ahy_B06g080163 [Arachis hypogaea]
MCFHAQMNDGVVDVYFEHGVSTPELIDGKEAVLCLDYIQEEEPGGDLNKKNTPEDTLNEMPHDKCHPDPVPPTPIPIPNSPTAIPVLENTPTTKPIHDDTKSMVDHENPKLHHIPNPKSTIKPNTTPTVKQNPKSKQNQKPKNTQPKPKPKFTSKPKPKFNPPKRITRSQGRGHWSANKGKQIFHVDLTATRSISDEGSLEDDSYVPVQEASSSSDDELVTQPIRKEVKKVQKVSAMAKGKEKMYKDTIMQDDDAIVADLSDVEVDLGFLGSPGDGLMYDALDPSAESDGANSWHSEEMKTPPNSEDELESDGESDEFPIFQEGQRFGELQLQVGMKFNTKQDFRDAVREFTIQEGRRIKFVNNDNVRCRAVCQVEECSWVVYTLRDHEDSCWQIKTFYDDHTCPRENSNRAANRVWLASKLVKKVRKYANFKQCEAATYFRKESKNWVPIWTGDEAYEKFEIHGQPTNMVFDLGKRLCTYQFWMLTGIPCVHACAALARVNKRPEDFCHPLVTMDSYRKTYEHYINPLLGQSMWEKSAYSQPQAPNIKRKPEKLTTKRRKDADEGTRLNKKAKQAVTLKRQLKSFTCTYCGRADKLAAALAAAAAAVAASKAKATPTGSTPAAEASNTNNPAPPTADIPPPVSAPQAEEVELSQPSYGGTQDEAPPPPTTRPPKLPTKRRTSPQPVTTSVDPMQGSSIATSLRLASFMKFVPTPQFKAPRKKNP